jgi:hypothetical protein
LASKADQAKGSGRFLKKAAKTFVRFSHGADTSAAQAGKVLLCSA